MTKTRVASPPSGMEKVGRLSHAKKTEGIPEVPEVAMVKTGEKERRLSERYRLKEPLAYAPSIGQKKNRAVCTAKAIDVSDGGVCFQTDQPLALHQIVRVALPVKGGKASSPTLAEVCSVNGEGGAYRIGLRFLL